MMTVNYPHWYTLSHTLRKIDPLHQVVELPQRQKAFSVRKGGIVYALPTYDSKNAKEFNEPFLSNGKKMTIIHFWRQKTTKR